MINNIRTLVNNMMNLFNGNKKWFGYAIDDGGAGLVLAVNENEAINKVRESYRKHGNISESNKITIYETCSFQNDIIEAFMFAE